MSWSTRLFRFREADGEGNREFLAADNIARFSIILGFLFTLAYPIQLILLIVYQNLGDINLLSWELAPEFSLAFVFIAAIVGVILSPVGCFGVVFSSRKASLVFFWGSFLLAILLLVSSVILLLSGNGAVIIGDRRVNSNDIEDGEVDLFSFSDITQKEIIQFSEEFPEEWERIQDELSCCGLNLRTIYAQVDFELDNFSLADFHSGFDCNVILNVNGEPIGGLQTLLNAFPLNEGFDDNAEGIVLTADTNNLDSVTFFCEVLLSQEIRGGAQRGGILVGIMTLFQILQMVLVGLLLYSYEEKDGGMKPNEDPLHLKARVEKTSAARAGYGVTGGGSLPAVVKNTSKKHPRASRVRFD